MAVINIRFLFSYGMECSRVLYSNGNIKSLKEEGMVRRTLVTIFIYETQEQ